MKVFIKARLSSRTYDDHQILGHVKTFAEDTGGYHYLVEDSQNYSKLIACPGCKVRLREIAELEAAEMALAQEKPGRFYVANVVPLDKGRLLIDEYNALVRRFVADFSRYLRKRGATISIACTKDTIGLDQIIPGKRTRARFKTYLAAFPTSYHALDIRRLDMFICTLSRYRCKVDVMRLKRWLMEDLAWNERDASWCTERIETGLDILEVHKNVPR